MVKYKKGRHFRCRLIIGFMAGMDLRMAQWNDNRVPGLKPRDTIRVPGIPGTRFRDTTQGHDRVPYRVPIVSLNRVP